MNTQSPRFSLNEKDKQTIISVVIHALIGTVLTLISMVFLHLNYGVYTPLVTSVLSLISLTLREYAAGPSSSTLKIQQLEETIQSLQQNQPQQSTS